MNAFQARMLEQSQNACKITVTRTLMAQNGVAKIGRHMLLSEKGESKEYIYIYVFWYGYIYIYIHI